MGRPVPCVGLGTLDALEIIPEGEQEPRMLRFRGEWLAWDPTKRRFLIGKPGAVRKAALPKQILTMHRRFHESAPQSVRVAKAPDPVGKLRQVALVKALTYRVPRSVRSPGKNPYTWHHAFGDTGHKGGDTYPRRVMPALMMDTKGNIFIHRRPGNIFRVDTWLRG